MASTCLQVMLVLLCFSHLICNNGAVPVTGSVSLQVEKSQGYEVTKTVQNMLSAEGIMRRMDAEVNDYPGSGANNRHTPRPQLGRSCMDC